jgi:hypothetical protein
MVKIKGIVPMAEMGKEHDNKVAIAVILKSALFR